MNSSDHFKSTASIDTLRQRAELLRRTRSFFDQRGFFEVQTPLLSADTVVDRHLDPVPVNLPNDPFDMKNGRPMWLQSSPEFAMKRLVASGAEAIYQITPAFRIGERGNQHNPEFTMLEWYRRGDDMQAGIRLLSEFASELLAAPSAEVKTIGHACQEHMGTNLLKLSATELKTQCVAAGITIPTSVEANDWDTWFDLLFSELVQPKLGHKTPVIVHDYPASQAALAKVRPNSEVAERFELFIRGVELANGYHELQDADELMHRNKSVNDQRRHDGKSQLPQDSRLLDAMRSGLPACSGVALGFDRLVMLATGANSIDDVIPFPIDRA